MNSTENQKTILLVEDEVVTAMAGKAVLEKYGLIPSRFPDPALHDFSARNITQ